MTTPPYAQPDDRAQNGSVARRLRPVADDGNAGCTAPPHVAAEAAPPTVPPAAVCSGVVVGLLMASLPVAFFWLPQVTVYAVALAVVGAIYVGFAVADGRTHVIAVETAVAIGFVLIAAAALSELTVSVQLVAVGLFLHGLKDLWQQRTQFVRNTRWWPPFCVAVDWTAALAIAALA